MIGGLFVILQFKPPYAEAGIYFFDLNPPEKVDHGLSNQHTVRAGSITNRSFPASFPCGQYKPIL
jgi:hypothetical protein